MTDYNLQTNLRLGFNFSNSPPPPTPLLGLQIPSGERTSISFYITTQPKDVYLASILRPQINLFNIYRLNISAYSEVTAGYFFHGTYGPDFPGGAQVGLGLGVEGCYKIDADHDFCLNAGYTAAWMERSVFTPPSSVRPTGWDGRNLLSIGLTLAFGI